MRIITRKMLSLLIAVLLVFSIAGCAQSEPAPPATTAQEPASAPAPQAEAETPPADAPEAPADESPTEEAPAPEPEPEAQEVVGINALFYDLRGIGAENYQPIIDQMNAITEKSAGVRIENATVAASADWVTQVGLAMASGEQLDVMSLIPRVGGDFITLYANGQLLDVTDLLQEYAPEAYGLVENYIGAFSVNGRNYGLPTYRNYTNLCYIVMRKDILDQIGMTEKAQNMTTWTELDEIFTAVAEQTDMTPLLGQKNTGYQAGMIFGADNFSDSVAFDTLSDNLRIVYADQDGNVSLLPENADFRNHMNLLKKWYDSGWVYEDSLVAEDHPDLLMKANLAFASIQTSEIGVESAKQQSTGHELICVPAAVNMLTSSFINKFGISVPVVSREPEAAVKWLNALYTDPALNNLIAWGEESVDYVVENGEAKYPEGITAENVRFHQSDFVHGNFFDMYPWEGQGADYRDVAMETLQSATISRYMGFTPDMSGMANTIAALSAVFDEMSPRLLCGAFDDAYYDEYLSRLKAAGADEYIAEMQTQLTAWVEANE